MYIREALEFWKQKLADNSNRNSENQNVDINVNNKGRSHQDSIENEESIRSLTGSHIFSTPDTFFLYFSYILKLSSQMSLSAVK